MNYTSRTITVGKSVAKSTKRRSRKARGIHTYWAELGFLLLAVLFIQPQLVEHIVRALATQQTESVLP